MADARGILEPRPYAAAVGGTGGAPKNIVTSITPHSGRALAMAANPARRGSGRVQLHLSISREVYDLLDGEYHMRALARMPASRSAIVGHALQTMQAQRLGLECLRRLDIELARRAALGITSSRASLVEECVYAHLGGPVPEYQRE
jgi:hypothetical protein